MKTGSGSRGFLLVELLTAAALFSIAGSSLYTGFVEGVRCYNRIEESRIAYSGPKIFFMRLEEDLRNMAALEKYPFQGGKEEIRFPAYLPGAGEGTGFRLVEVRYFLRAGRLIRSEEELGAKLNEGSSFEKTVLSNVEEALFEFPYEDEKGARTFEDFWVEEPYAGLPRAVRLTLKTGGLELQKLVSVPHGAFGTAEGKGETL